MTPYLSQILEGEHAPDRRLFLKVAGLGSLTAAWPLTSAASPPRSDARRPRRFGQARSCIVVFLFGGPGQQDLWDMKPGASAEIRGEFNPIATSVPGISICEHLPELSRQADKFSIIRSMSHRDFEHGSASYTALTGHPHPKPGTNTPASPDDFPTYGAVVARLKGTDKPVPSAAVLGPVMHQGNRPPMAGQNSGFMGKAYDPYRIADDPNAASFRVSGLAAPAGVGGRRLIDRHRLLRALDVDRSRWSRSPAVRGMNQLKRRAAGLLGSSQTRHAFDLARESDEVRDRYGRHKFGQTMLLARRLVEAEVPLITVNWSRQNADQWDTHKQNYPTLRKLLPPFDRGLAALLDDLGQRGLLDTTLVVCLGEFGRTPKINKDAGRDHWPDCYSAVLAGGGIRRGSILGASDRHAAYPKDASVAPWDLAASMYHLVGIDPRSRVHDRLDRPHVLSPGRIVEELLA